MAITINQEVNYIVHGPEVRVEFDNLLRKFHGEDVDIDNLNMPMELQSTNAVLGMTLQEALSAEPDMSDDITFEMQDGELVYDHKPDELPPVPETDEEENIMAVSHFGDWTQNMDWDFIGDLIEFAVKMISIQQK